jgi:hypothetical protein
MRWRPISTEEERRCAVAERSMFQLFFSVVHILRILK